LSCDTHAATIERFERDLEPLPFFAQPIFLRHFAIGKNNFRRTRRPQAHFIFVAAHAKAGERGLADVLSLEFEPAPDVLSSVLTFCDMTTSPDGELVPVERRAGSGREVSAKAAHMPQVLS